MSLRDLLRHDGASLPDIAAYLDGLSPKERLAETRTMNRDEQRRLYRAAASAPPLTLSHFVPDSVSPGAAVHHDGRNTLPLPAPWKLFQKRFAKPQDGRTDRLFGYNESPFVGTIGPGFFVTVLTAGRPEWEARGAVVVDYFQVPDGAVPAGWPPVIPNTKGFQTFVYNRTRDFMRGVSTHVSIGAAYKVEKALDHYFVLCREP